MPKYDVMIEYRAELSGSDDLAMLGQGLDEITHGLRRYSAVVALHGDVLSVEGEIEASGPMMALAALKQAFERGVHLAGLQDSFGVLVSFWSTDTERTKAQLLLFNDKTA